MTMFRTSSKSSIRDYQHNFNFSPVSTHFKLRTLEFLNKYCMVEIALITNFDQDALHQLSLTPATYDCLVFHFLSTLCLSVELSTTLHSGELGTSESLDYMALYKLFYLLT